MKSIVFKSTVSSSVAGEPPRVSATGASFALFNVSHFIKRFRTKPTMNQDRRAYYKIGLNRGRSRVECLTQAAEIRQNALWFSSDDVPYRWLPHDLNQAGYFCLFTAEFLLPFHVRELPLFQPSAYWVWELSENEWKVLEGVFQKMMHEVASDYALKDDLLRVYLLELIHLVQKYRTATASILPAPARLALQFTQLLEQQFPLDGLRGDLRLRTAQDFAEHLSVHANYLNRVLKNTTGQTTTTLIGARLTKEAQQLLRYTTSTVSEIADQLGFASVAHFCTFFKRQTGTTPGSVSREPLV